MPKKSARSSKKSPARKSKSLKRKSTVRKSRSQKKKSKEFVKKLIKSLTFSEEDIENLMNQHAPTKMSEKDGAIIKERLRKFVYDPSYKSPFFNRNPKWSLADATYFQAAARLGEYGKGVLEANEI